MYLRHHLCHHTPFQSEKNKWELTELSITPYPNTHKPYLNITTTHTLHINHHHTHATHHPTSAFCADITTSHLLHITIVALTITTTNSFNQDDWELADLSDTPSPDGDNSGAPPSTSSLNPTKSINGPISTTNRKKRNSVITTNTKSTNTTNKNNSNNSLGYKETDSIGKSLSALSMTSTVSSSNVLSVFLPPSHSQSTTTNRIKDFAKRETSHLELNHKLREAELTSYREELKVQRTIMLVLAYAMAGVFTVLSLWVVRVCMWCVCVVCVCVRECTCTCVCTCVCVYVA